MFHLVDQMFTFWTNTASSDNGRPNPVRALAWPSKPPTSPWKKHLHFQTASAPPTHLCLESAAAAATSKRNRQFVAIWTVLAMTLCSICHLVLGRLACTLRRQDCRRPERHVGLAVAAAGASPTGLWAYKHLAVNARTLARKAILHKYSLEINR